MKLPLSALDGRQFDVVVVGGGVNGASAAQHLSAAGYDVLVVDKGDFASGASSRSSRVLHCGLRYLAPGNSMWEFVTSPKKLRVACSMARQAMIDRRDFVQSSPERSRRTTFFYPMYHGGTYAPWQVKMAFRLLAWLGPEEVPLGSGQVPSSEFASTPLVKYLREPERLSGVMSFHEYVFDWPERITIDEILDAERMGATARNYTRVTHLAQEQGNSWAVALADANGKGGTAVVRGKIVLNMAGVWIDRVNQSAGAGAKRKIFGTKGANILFRLPPENAGFGLAGLNREKEPMYVRPWRSLHYCGPTETVFEGDPDDVHATDDDIEFLLEEANYALPGMKLTRDKIIYTWAGVRPLTYDPAFPKGKRSRDVHDQGAEGMPNVISVTAGPIMTHRSVGPEMTAMVRQRLAPSRTPQVPSFKGREFPAPGVNAEPLVPGESAVTAADLVVSARGEHVETLVDLLCRRADIGWTSKMGMGVARQAADAVAAALGWDDARVAQEVDAYQRYLDHTHRVRRA